MKYLSLASLIIILFNINIFCQEDVQIGMSLRAILNENRGALFDYSKPDEINMRVLVWGNVAFPGEYVIPSTSNLNELLSLAGGPTDDAEIDELRIYRLGPDSVQKMIKFSYNDLLWNDKLTKPLKIPQLKPSDVLLIPGRPRFFFLDYFDITLSLITTISAIAVLMITIFKK